jgi:hypothetical protein
MGRPNRPKIESKFPVVKPWITSHLAAEKYNLLSKTKSIRKRITGAQTLNTHNKISAF